MSSSTIVLNSSNIVNTENNTFVYKFPNSVQFPHHQIALQSVSMYYSWENINSTTLNNNSLSISYYSNNILITKTIVIPNGLYEVTDLNNYFQFWSIENGLYLIDDVGNYVYFFEIMVNPTYYAVQINTYPIPISLPTNYTAPSNWIGFYSSSYNPQLTIFTNFNNVIGFPANFQTPLNPPTYTGLGSSTEEGVYSILSSDFGLTPNIQPNSNILFSISNINNKYANPSTIIYSLTPAVAIGQQIIEKPPQFSYNRLLAGTYNEIRLQLLGYDMKPLTILDKNIVILLSIRDVKEDINILNGK